ncbi:protein FAM107B-like isoform X3 [Scyliorhinus canicula]|uniref:protein FAM107B-like isoform X3 n=1 Tax=Scyliorhinus canicula TaxID=7830 RepID=UPI0018F2A4F6|nr:protein FAM107B-like isoform X3 [Scyliorhinus canicula]
MWNQARASAGFPRGMLVKSASMYSERHSNPSEIRSLMAEPDYFDDNPELIKPKKLLNPVKASRSHQELHRELLMNQKRFMVHLIRSKSLATLCLEEGTITNAGAQCRATLYEYQLLCGVGSENKPELQRVLEYRRREQLIRQRKEEEEAQKMKSPFEVELLKRQQRMEELEREQEGDEEEQENAPEFIKVKENLRRTSTFSTEKKAG